MVDLVFSMFFYGFPSVIFLSPRALSVQFSLFIRIFFFVPPFPPSPLPLVCCAALRFASAQCGEEQQSPRPIFKFLAPPALACTIRFSRRAFEGADGMIHKTKNGK